MPCEGFRQSLSNSRSPTDKNANRQSFRRREPSRIEGYSSSVAGHSPRVLIEIYANNNGYGGGGENSAQRGEEHMLESISYRPVRVFILIARKCGAAS